MTGFEWALLAALVGVGGYAGYRHFHPKTTEATTTPNDTRATVFGDPKCQAQYNALSSTGKAQVDAAVKQAKVDGPKPLNEAADILRKAGYKEIADCLTSLAKTTTPGGGGTQPMSTGGAGAKLFTGACLDTYQKLPTAERTAIDAAIEAAKRAPDGPSGAKILAAYANGYTNADPATQMTVRACIVAAAVTMNGGNALTPGTGGFATAGSGRALMSGTCQTTYDQVSPETRAYLDRAADSANAAGGGESGARVLLTASQTFMTGAPAPLGDQPQVYACLVDAAIRMNGGKMPADEEAFSAFNPNNVMTTMTRPWTSGVSGRSPFAFGS